MRQHMSARRPQTKPIDLVGRPDAGIPSRYKALQALGSVVYAVRIGDLVKIGHTTDLGRRIHHLRHRDSDGAEVELLAFIFGSYDDEQSLHDQLAASCDHGREWYWPSPDVMAVVDEMRASVGMGPLPA